jgi:hypothetical protein
LSEQIFNLRKGAASILLGFDPAQPIAQYQDHDTSQGRKPQVQRAQRKKRPPTPNANEMTHNEPGDAQTKIQEQSPKTSVAQQMIQRAIKQCNEESQEQSWKSHVCKYQILDKIQGNM